MFDETENNETAVTEVAITEAEIAQDTAPEHDEGEKKLSGAELNAAVEALLFAAMEPLKLEAMAKALGRGIRRDAISEAIGELNEFYQSQNRSFCIMEVAGKYSLMSRPEFAPFIQNLHGNKPSKEENERKLSPALLDTLAIIAYKQPVTRAEVETVRGVGCGQLIRQLMERGSVKPVGKKMEVIGCPLLYGTTELFLQEFGLSALDELPMLQELRQLKIVGDKPAEDKSVKIGEKIATIVAEATNEDDDEIDDDIDDEENDDVDDDDIDEDDEDDFDEDEDDEDELDDETEDEKP